jgi:hypothetical protein
MNKLEKYGGVMKTIGNHFLIGYKGFLLLLVGLAFMTSLSNAQLKMSVTYVPVQTLSPSDIDFEHFESRNLLFTVTISNTSGQIYTAKLAGTVDIHLADGSYDGRRAATFTTKAFEVETNGLTFTNLNIGRNGSIGTEQFFFDQKAKDRLNDAVLSTGKFPAGSYTFHLDLTDTSAIPLDHADVGFEIQNNSRVELRSPQDGETTNEFPFFEFFQEGTQAVLTVAEKSENQSREEAISRQPAMIEKELAGQNSFLYAGGRPLEQGKTYVWQVISKSLSAGGAYAEVSSPIWTFTVSTLPQGGSEPLILSQLLELLAVKNKAIHDEIQSGGYTVGPYTLNGNLITPGELLNLLNELRDNDTVEVTFE